MAQLVELVHVASSRRRESKRSACLFGALILVASSRRRELKLKDSRRKDFESAVASSRRRELKLSFAELHCWPVLSPPHGGVS